MSLYSEYIYNILLLLLLCKSVDESKERQEDDAVISAEGRSRRPLINGVCLN